MRPVKFLQILGVAAALAGYSAWVQHERGPKAAAVEGAGDGIPLIRLARAEELWHDRGTLFVDVRPPFDYEVGHIAGAVNLPERDFEARFPDLKPRLGRARTVVVYCKSQDCGASLWAAIRLRNEGVRQCVIYPEGWNEWYTRGLPVSRKPD